MTQARKAKSAQGRAPAISIRLPMDLVARIDAIRDPLVPREPYIRQLIADQLTTAERIQRPRRSRNKSR